MARCRRNQPVLAWEGRGTIGAVEVAPPGDAEPPPAGTLFAGDNLGVMQGLARRCGACIDLMYIDPPFATRVAHGVRVGGEDALAYDDRWGSLAEYLAFMQARVALMRAILAPSGFLFVHCDWRANAYLRVLLDEVFGPDCFRNEIVWRRAPNLGRQAASKQLGRTADSIFVYGKTPGGAFPGPAPTVRRDLPVSRRGTPVGAQWDARAGRWFTTAPRGDYTEESVARLEREGRIHRTASGTVYVKYWVEEERGAFFRRQPVDTIWDDEEVRPLRFAGKRELAVEYVTQKPESLLRRIIAWSSPPGGLVADFFCGSGTTPVVAHALGRRWIACDVGDLAVRATTKRLRDAGAAVSLVPAGEAGAPAAHGAAVPRITRRKASKSETAREAGPRTRVQGVEP
ncbi:MAG TPA: site-specific DNA-methyltransferase [Phycisphaerales bacterium]|nr:site-specific DNA-methyltransferase [Phycisphaerales bacterium]